MNTYGEWQDHVASNSWASIRVNRLGEKMSDMEGAYSDFSLADEVEMSSEQAAAVDMVNNFFD